MSEELETIEKIEWLNEYEGCELADGYGAFQTFLMYCCSNKNATKILDIISDDVDYQYEETKRCLDDQGDWRDEKFMDLVNSLWEDLTSNVVINSMTANLIEASLKEKWMKKLKEAL